MRPDFILEICNRLDKEGKRDSANQLFSAYMKSMPTAGSVRLAKKRDDIKKTTISAKHMKNGYEIRKETWSMKWTGSEDIEMESVYNHHGDYIGDVKTAKVLIEKGIIPEISNPEHSVCSIGYSTLDGKWYGWSHRAIKGFGYGDKAETLDPVQSTKSKNEIKTLEEAKQAAIDFAESVS
jgi:hypothetical protein